jgi:hypothetical protein
MKKFLLLVLVSFPLMAADEFVTLYDCHTPNVADTGFQVLVETGGFAGTTQVTLSASNFMGSKLIGKYIVSGSEVEGSTIYQGKDIQLNVGPGFYPHYSGTDVGKVHNASFSAVGTNGKKYQGKLQCSSRD